MAGAESMTYPRLEQYLVDILRERGELHDVPLRRQLNGELDRDIPMEDVHATCVKLEQDGIIVSRYEPADPDRGTEAETYWRLVQ